MSVCHGLFILSVRPSERSIRTDSLLPYATFFRSRQLGRIDVQVGRPALKRHRPSPFAPAFAGAGSELVEGLFFPCDAEKKERCFDKLSTNGRKGDAD